MKRSGFVLKPVLALQVHRDTDILIEGCVKKPKWKFGLFLLGVRMVDCPVIDRRTMGDSSWIFLKFLFKSPIDSLLIFCTPQCG